MLNKRARARDVICPALYGGPNPPTGRNYIAFQKLSCCFCKFNVRAPLHIRVRFFFCVYKFFSIILAQHTSIKGMEATMTTRRAACLCGSGTFRYVLAISMAVCCCAHILYDFTLSKRKSSHRTVFTICPHAYDKRFNVLYSSFHTIYFFLVKF